MSHQKNEGSTAALPGEIHHPINLSGRSTKKGRPGTVHRAIVVFDPIHKDPKKQTRTPKKVRKYICREGVFEGKGA